RSRGGSRRSSRCPSCAPGRSRITRRPGRFSTPPRPTCSRGRSSCRGWRSTRSSSDASSTSRRWARRRSRWSVTRRTIAPRPTRGCAPWAGTRRSWTSSPGSGSAARPPPGIEGMPRPASGRRSIAAALVVCLAGAAGVVLAAQTAPPAKYSRMQRLEQWTAALEQHQPGEKDAPLDAFRDWTAPEFAELKTSFSSALQIVRDPTIRTFLRPPLANGRPSTQVFYSRDEIRQLVDVAKRLRKLGENHMLRRGAMLHMDAVVLGSGNEARPGPRRSDFYIYHMD